MSNIGYDQNFECMICFDNRNKYFAHTLVDMSAPTFTRYEIEEHLRTKHTLYDILQWLTAHHHEVMMERINPTSRCNFPDKMRGVDYDSLPRKVLEEFQKEYKLTFKSKKKPKVKSKKKPRKLTKKERNTTRLIKQRAKNNKFLAKQLKVKARITHK